VNIFLWVLQGLLALHTLMGAVWKFKTTAEQTMPSLKAIPAGVWTGLGVFEILCAIALVLPAIYRPLGFLAPAAAIAIALVMVAYCVLHMQSGTEGFGPMIYWSVVAAICLVIAYGRLVLSPFEIG
jgi:hypothetical protein